MISIVGFNLRAAKPSRSRAALTASRRSCSQGLVCSCSSHSLDCMPRSHSLSIGLSDDFGFYRSLCRSKKVER